MRFENFQLAVSLIEALGICKTHDEEIETVLDYFSLVYEIGYRECEKEEIKK